MTSTTSTRKVYLDILRITASFLVCYNHAYGFHLFLDQEPNGSLVSWINVMLSVFTTLDIPLFFMLSGALLLGREESYKTLLQKRIWRFAVLIFFASLITYAITKPGSFVFSDLIYGLFKGDINGSHWYLFAYLGFLFALPFLRKISAHLKYQDILFLVILRVIFVSGMMVLNYWLSYFGIQPITLSSYLQIPFSLLEFLFYPITGYYLAVLLPIDKIRTKEIMICLVVFLAGSSVSAIMTYVEGIHSAFSQTYLGLFNYTSAMSFFVLVRYLVSKVSIPKRICKALTAVSSVTIGIYLLEPLVAHFLYTPFFHFVPWHPVIITCFSVLWCFFCMAVGGSLTYFLRKIPGVKKYL